MKGFVIVLLSAAAFVTVDGGEAKEVQAAYDTCKTEFKFEEESDGTCNFGEKNDNYKCTMACMGKKLEVANEKGELQEDKINAMIDEAVNSMTKEDREKSVEDIDRIKAAIQTCAGQVKDFADNGPDCKEYVGGQRLWNFSKCLCEKMKPKE